MHRGPPVNTTRMGEAEGRGHSFSRFYGTNDTRCAYIYIRTYIHAPIEREREYH